MIEFGLLLVVVLALYLMECAVWIPAGSLAFLLCSPLDHSLKLIVRPRPIERPSLAFSNPFVPWRAIMVCNPPRIWCSGDGIVSGCADFEQPSTKNGGNVIGNFVPFEEIRRLESEGKNLYVNGAKFASLGSEAEATFLAKWLQGLKSRAKQERAAEIYKEIKRKLAPERAAQVLSYSAQKIYSLGLDCLILTVATFLAMPFVVWRWGLSLTWPFLISFMIFNVGLIGWEFHSGQHDLYPQAKEARWMSMAMILLSPPAAMRATRYLAKDIAWDFHPLAMAAAAGSKGDFELLASWFLRDLTFSAELPVGGNLRAIESATWCRERFRLAVIDLVRKRGLDETALISPRIRESGLVQSYCPRCLCQYTVISGVCEDCGGISLLPHPMKNRGLANC
ncbi:MAG TPA: hypothetical protein VEG64_02295 [Candidatus Sulfotelmatobacter sp.]|nr:hypothetical protein [Candidatus Sulfotelmatobacter sp.]